MKLRMETDNRYMLQRLDVIEAKLTQVLVALEANEDDQWITSSKACQLMSISDRQLTRLISSGVINGPAIRNIGSVKSPRYRFHQAKMMNQWLRKAVK